MPGPPERPGRMPAGTPIAHFLPRVHHRGLSPPATRLNLPLAPPPGTGYRPGPPALLQHRPGRVAQRESTTLTG